MAAGFAHVEGGKIFLNTNSFQPEYSPGAQRLGSERRSKKQDKYQLSRHHTVFGVLIHVHDVYIYVYIMHIVLLLVVINSTK